MRRSLLGAAVAMLVVFVPPALAAAPERVRTKAGVWKFAETPPGEAHPGLAFRGPTAAGAVYFTTGWAVEAVFTDTTGEAVIFGKAIRSARTVRIGNVARVKVGRWSPRSGVRWFAARVPTSARRVKPNDIASYDARGRLLGRQHSENDFSRCGGIWDRKHLC